ncbi:MAG: alpha/beta fold hydrolase, partial [Cytophagales bacterium]|nr:alpha/beta fold hydrolase [Cytophagales bacterium]
DYMVPAFVVDLPQLPLTGNGKLDKRALPLPEAGALLRDHYQPPQGALEAKLALLWQQLLGVEQVGRHDNFFRLGGHSLLILQLISVIRDALVVEIVVKDIFNHPTVAGLAAILTEQYGVWLREYGADAPPLTPDSGCTHGTDAINPHVVLLHPGAAATPLFVLPGAGGFCEGYRDLTSAFGSECPVYGLQMMGTQQGEQPLESLGEIAAQNLQWIKQIQPEGPYRFIGHSLGGVVAFEMIRQLEAEGMHTDFAVILDAAITPPKGRTTQFTDADLSILEFLFEHLEKYNLMQRPYPDWTGHLTAELLTLDRKDAKAHMVKATKARFPDEKHAFVLRALDLVLTNLLMPSAAGGKVHAELLVVRAAETNWDDADESLNWAQYAAKVQVIVAAGDHDSMVKDENARALGKVLKGKMQLH